MDRHRANVVGSHLSDVFVEPRSSGLEWFRPDGVLEQVVQTVVPLVVHVDGCVSGCGGDGDGDCGDGILEQMVQTVVSLMVHVHTCVRV
jgi:hypothetical protein